MAGLVELGSTFVPFQAYLLGADQAVRVIDIGEVDATADLNGITICAAASVFLTFCAGLAKRPGP
jgi:hypothetical protein